MKSYVHIHSRGVGAASVGGVCLLMIITSRRLPIQLLPKYVYTRNLDFFLFISSAHRRRFCRFRGIYFLFFNLHTGKRRWVRGLSVLHYIKIAPARAREYHSLSSPSRVVSAQNQLSYTHMCIIIYIFVSALCSVRVCVFILSPPCAAVRAVWSTDGELLLYICPSGGRGDIGMII